LTTKIAEMFGGPVIVLSKYSTVWIRFTIIFCHFYTYRRGKTQLSVVGGNTKREQGRKVQESNVAAAKVSDNMSIVHVGLW